MRSILTRRHIVEGKETFPDKPSIEACPTWTAKAEHTRLEKMRDQQRLPASPQRRREELFTQRYAQLRAWALRLTNQNRESAEDLVQDAFIQFALGRTSLEDIDNIDGYLRRMLRYMHLSRINRGAQRFLDQTISLSDYDSFQQTWRAIAPPDRMQAQEELCRICAYACSRKETSRAGSVLILRFFHDYYPTEIARILCTSRHCVDQWQRLARSELKLYLTGPTRLRFVNAKSKATTKTVLTKLSCVNCDVLGELRQMIFRSRQGQCLQIYELREIYEQGNGEVLTTAKLGHLVSCPTCLDVVNQILGLPLLAERRQAEIEDSKSPPPDDTSGSSAGPSNDNPKSDYRRRLREVREHKPQELRIAVNGSIFGSLKVSSDRSELDLNLGQHLVDFVEVYSEQGVQLMFLSVSETARTTTEQWARIELSEGRSLEARLCFKSDPVLHLIYIEPEQQPSSAPTRLQVVEEDSPIPCKGDQPNVSGWKSAFRSVQLIVRTILGNRRLTTDESDESRQRALLVRTALPRKCLWTRPEFATAVVGVLMISAFLVFKNRISSTEPASRLLVRAILAEETLTHEVGQVTRRSVTLEERRSAQGPLISRQRIEIWEKSDQTASARRVYDDNNRLTAGAWNQGNGSVTVYHHGAKPKTQAIVETPGFLLMNLNDVWQLELSAKEFKMLIRDPEATRVEETGTNYTLSYEKETQIGASRLLKARLTLSRPDLHATEQTLLIERSGDVREYRLVETSFERLPQSAVKPDVFEIDKELVDAKPVAAKARDIDSLPMVSTTASNLPVASTELEIDVAYLLNQANGERNEQIRLSRTSNGSLEVEGIVESEQRKNELLHALAPIINNPAVKIEITSVKAMQHRAVSPLATTIRAAEDTANTIALYDELHAYFSKTKVSQANTIEREQREDEVDEYIRSFSTSVVNRAYRVLFHAIELQRLANRFAGVDMHTVSSDARFKWLQMTREHATIVQRETAELEIQLQPILFAGRYPSPADEFDIAGDMDLWRAIERLHEVALANNQAIRDAFTISAKTSSEAITSPQFRHSLLVAQRLGGSITKYSTR